MNLASSVSVHGLSGVLFLLAAICFLAGAIVAGVVLPRPGKWWPVLLLAGLLLWVLTGLVH